MRILVDTNVFLDIILDREEAADIAHTFFRNCYINNHQIYLSAMSLRDIGYVAHREYHDNWKTLNAQLRAYELCTKVISITNDDAITSLYSDMEDFEDSLIVEAAKREMLDLIVTNNIKDFKNSRFPVWTPKEFNEVLEKYS